MTHVWYASYGSNMLEERFLCYIQGGRPDGSLKIERGARDRTPPLCSTPFRLPYDLYFAKEQTKWGFGGVAFIRNEINPHTHTFSKAYLITIEQFIDVVKQENQLDSISIHFDELYKLGSLTLEDGWYNKLVVAGFMNDLPVLTFTSDQDWPQSQENKPAKAYEQTLLKGLLQLDVTKEEAISYLTSHYPQ